MALMFLSFALGALLMGLAMVCNMVDETLLLMILMLICSTVWLFYFQEGPAQTLYGAAPKRLSTGEVGVQCDLLSPKGSRDTASGAVYIAPTGTRWHGRRSCGHLKMAMKVTQLTPCLTCSSAESG